MTMRSVLLIGYGNPGRLDDGLGPRLAEALEQRGIQGLELESNYQLAVEDAENVARHNVVIFADAAVRGTEPFYFRRAAPAPRRGFDSHGVEPEDVLDLAVALFGAQPEAYVLGIRGYDFDGFGERLSERAARNLAAAVDFLEGVIRRGDFAGAVCGDEEHVVAALL